MKITVIVADASPLITLAVADALDILLLPEVKVIIPDMVNFEVTRHINKQGARELQEWIGLHQFKEVFLGSTETFNEFVIIHELNPSVKSRNRGEMAAVEILQMEINNGVDAAILLFEDSDIKKANFIARLPDNVLVMSTSTFLDGLQKMNLITSSDEILKKAVKIRGDDILNREIIPMSNVEDLEESWTSSFCLDQNHRILDN
jgi:predicted nucleic acid-binding protein